MKIKRSLYLIIILLTLNSCKQEFPYEKIIEIKPDEPMIETKRKWTFIVYMAADNDLESAAIEDLNEMEAVSLNGVPITILVLLDRSPGYDSTNGNWSDTRVYEVKNDRSVINTVINSKRIACPPLGISVDSSNELNMADPLILDYFLTFAKNTYPADEYALIFWGHGTGWRSSTSEDENQNIPMKAIAVDESSSDYMTITEAQEALKGKELSLIGFDTCFGALLEIAYEFRYSAKYLIGSEGVTSSKGWNYTSLFQSFLHTDLCAKTFGKIILSQFRDQYTNMTKATISLFDLSKLQVLKTDFENFCTVVASSIITGEERKVVQELLLQKADLYHPSSYPCDVYIDISSMCIELLANVTRITPNIVSQNAIREAGNTLDASISASIIESWSQDSNERKRIGVHLIPFISSETPQSSHSPGYINGSGAINQCAFVRESSGWVPNSVNKGSLLDIVFYSTF